MQKELERQTSLEAFLQGEEWHSQSLTIVVYGASGDLAKKKTYPALFALFVDSFLPAHSIICGYARSDKSDEEIRAQLRPYLLKKGSEEDVDKFLKICFYRHGQYDSVEDMRRMSEQLTKMHGSPSVENRVFYFALPPEVFATVAKALREAALTQTGYNRIIVEKPFGHDTESAIKLSEDLAETFDESYLYRIDHYLGKEMVQNLIVLRFSNCLFDPLWNNNYVKCVMITFKEDIGTMGRGGYFDKSGIIRDVMQNHLMQVLSLVAMEPPVKVTGEGYSNYIRDEKVKLLKAIEPWKLENTVLGQYTSNGDEPGYLDDETVPEGSNCPTYACIVMNIRNKRWDGVPFIMKAGKALNERKAEIRIQLKRPHGGSHMFDNNEIPHNEIVMRLQPDEAIYVKTNVKFPGLNTKIKTSELDLSYKTRFKNASNPDAYTRLVLDVLRGKQATFVRKDELIAAWEIATPLLKEIEERKIQPEKYKFGTRGPESADKLIEKAGYTYDSKYEWDDE